MKFYALPLIMIQNSHIDTKEWDIEIINQVGRGFWQETEVQTLLYKLDMEVK